MTMRFDQDQHADYATLVLVADGEVDARQTTALKSHLDNCAECRARMTALQGMIQEFDAARSESIDSRIPTAEASRARLKAQLSLMAAKQERPSWKRFSPVPTRITRWGYLTSAVATITLTAFISFSVFTPAISAQEFLVRASAAQGPSGPGKRAFRIRLEGKDFNYKSEELRRRGRSIFALARLDWDDPLSPTAFARWHDNVSERSDEVTRAKGRLTLRTTTKTDLVREASYTVEERTWLPVVETVALRDGRNVEITALPQDSTSSVDAQEGDVPRVPETMPASETAKESGKEATSASFKGVTVEDSEVFARVALHKIGAQDGGQVEFRGLNSDVLSVRTLVESEAHKQLVLSALAAIPHVRPDIRTFSEAAANPSVPVQRPTPNPAVVATAIPAFQHELETLFPNTDARAAFVNSVLTESQRVSAEAWETGLLVRRYGEGDVRKLGPTAREALEDLIRDHLDALTSAVQDTAARIKPLIAAPETDAESNSPAKPWREALLLLTQQALSLNAELQEALVASADGRSATKLRGVIVSDLRGLENGLELPRRETYQHFLKNEESTQTK